MLHLRRLLSLAAALCVSVLWACAADQYAPCDGGSDSCSQATRMSGDFEGCLCTYYCESDDDCPTPETGNAVPRCTPFGDVVENGESASCTLPCDEGTQCPDGMVCHTGQCWGTIRN